MSMISPGAKRVLCLLFVLVCVGVPAIAQQPEPAATVVEGAADADPAVSVSQLHETVTGLQENMNYIWVLTAAALVFMM